MFVGYSRDPFRRFDRDAVSSIMKKMSIDARDLSGPSRAASENTTLTFETFTNVLSDPIAYFAEAMTIELEHGKAAGVVNSDITGDDPTMSAKIAVAHIAGVESDEADSRETFPSYYDWLIWIEGIRTASLSKHQ